LENVLQELKPLAEQGNVEGFFNNPKNVVKLSGLVGDIHDAVIDYQVCNQNRLITPVLDSDILSRLHYNKMCMTRVANSL